MEFGDAGGRRIGYHRDNRWRDHERLTEGKGHHRKFTRSATKKTVRQFHGSILTKIAVLLERLKCSLFDVCGLYASRTFWHADTLIAPSIFYFNFLQFK